MPAFSFSGAPPATLGIAEGRFRRCPSTPNCVCSDATGRVHRIEPLRFSGKAEAAWGEACFVVQNLPRTEIVARESDYLHAECESRLLGFIDDLELHLRPEEGVGVDASRSGPVMQGHPAKPPPTPTATAAST